MEQMEKGEKFVNSMGENRLVLDDKNANHADYGLEFAIDDACGENLTRIFRDSDGENFS